MRRTFAVDAILILAAVLITHALTSSHPIIGPDSRGYIIPAENLAAGRGLLGDGSAATFITDIPGFPKRPSPDTARSPVVPAMIAASLAAGFGLRGVIVLQWILDLTTAILLYAVVRRRLDSRATALAAAMFFTACPPVAGLANQIGSETLFTLVVLVALILVLHACDRSSATLMTAAGLTLGFAALVRPIAMYFAVPLAVIAFLSTKRVRLALFLVIAAQVFPAAWMWRNVRETGVAIVTTMPADALLAEWAAGIHATRNESHLLRLVASQRSTGFRAALQRSRLPLFYQAMAIARAEGVDPVGLSPAEKSVYEKKLALYVIRSHPLAMAELMTSAVVELLIMIPAAAISPPGATLWLAVAACGICLALIVLGVGVRAVAKRDRTLALVIALTVIYFSVTASIPETVSRYAAVYIPWYGLGLICGVRELFFRWRADGSQTSRQP